MRSFGPLGQPFKNVVSLSYEELEALRLVDYEDMDQEEAAAQMGISRKCLWLDLHSARVKLAKAVIEGDLIQIEGGSFVLRSPERKARKEEVPDEEQKA